MYQKLSEICEYWACLNSNDKHFRQIGSTEWWWDVTVYLLFFFHVCTVCLVPTLLQFIRSVNRFFLIILSESRPVHVALLFSLNLSVITLPSLTLLFPLERENISWANQSLTTKFVRREEVSWASIASFLHDSFWSSRETERMCHLKRDRHCRRSQVGPKFIIGSKVHKSSLDKLLFQVLEGKASRSVLSLLERACF